MVMPYKDKEKQRESQKKHYQANRQEYVDRAKVIKDNHRIRNRSHVDAYLVKNPCVDCGNTDIRVLEFDHVRDTKVNSISTLIYSPVSLSNIDKEIAKCEVRCANCHRIVTCERRA